MAAISPTATVACGNCRGTGVRYDITCADNINTGASATSPCRICAGTGEVTPTTPAEKPYWLAPGYVPTTAVPAELSWMEGF